MAGPKIAVIIKYSNAQEKNLQVLDWTMISRIAPIGAKIVNDAPKTMQNCNAKDKLRCFFVKLNCKIKGKFIELN